MSKPTVKIPTQDVDTFKHTLSNCLGNALFKVNDDLHSDLVGKILTIVDASVNDVDQRKAVKDLMRNALGEISNKMFKTAISISGQIGVIVGDAEPSSQAQLSDSKDYSVWIENPYFKYTREE